MTQPASEQKSTRMTTTSRSDLCGEKVDILDDGFVQLVDVMGSDAAVVQAARVSYGAGTKQVSEDRHLIRYLMRHRHTTPFEMCEVKFLVRVPMDCWRQWIRHRTANVNEYSTRYSEAIDSCQKTGEKEWRAQSKSNRQGSADLIEEWPNGWGEGDEAEAERGFVETMTPGEYLEVQEASLHKTARSVYEERLRFGVAREQARKDLPLSNYTEAYWKVDLHNLFHFLSLRMDTHAQYEIRQYAAAIGYEFVSKLFPACWDAFCDYRLGGMFLSAKDIRALSAYINGMDLTLSEVRRAADREFGNSTREQGEFDAKMERLGFVAF